MAELDKTAFAEQLVSFDMPADDARSSVNFIDDEMKRCILSLYPSAVHVGREWYQGLEKVTSPSLVMWGSNDPFLPHVFADGLGAATRAEAVVKLRCGHWPSLERPGETAREFEAHWQRAVDVP
jgi:pimeloyl-ACP methyl ester carboxylesterase